MKEENNKQEVAENSRNSEHRSIYSILEADITASDIPEFEKKRKMTQLMQLKNQKVNILVAGVTGVGKSSTINALFDMEMAKVGVGVDPETSLIEKYTLDNLVVWDTPGLGDNVGTDKKIRKQIIEKLNETDENGNALIDMVLVLLDASAKDYGTTYNLINTTLAPCLGKDAEKRIVIAINQADIAMKGNHWDSEKNEPDEVLTAFLEKKTNSVKERFLEATGLNLEPIYFCAGYKEEEGGEQRRPYNLMKLLYHIVKAIPKEKRIAVFENLNKDEENWTSDDGKEDYAHETLGAFNDGIGFWIADGIEEGSEIGRELLGIPGMIVGGVVGGVFGVIKGIFENF